MAQLNKKKTETNIPGISGYIDFIIIGIYTVIAISFLFFPILNETIIRSALGLGLILFCPGYALIAALSPSNKDFEWIERIALSFALSIVVVPFIGLALNFTPWGIRLETIAPCIAIFTIGCIFLAVKRRREIKPEKRFFIDTDQIILDLRSKLFPASEDQLDKVLTIVLVLSVIFSIATISYVILIPRPGEKFTEFYFLGPDGKVNSYQKEINMGNSVPVIVGITNHEYRNITYEISIVLNDNNTNRQLYSRSVELADGATWEGNIELKPDKVGENKIEFELYIDGQNTTPYRELYFWENVIQSNSASTE